ncbi:MAG: hypothetical protein GKR92_08840 [Gammaproteobacteria bacterium]|nr:MAG: hypothetical protein GKR92_08840 [Gammaproteobacteria bacterium]
MKAFIFTIFLYCMTVQHAYSAVTTITCDYDAFASIQRVEQAIEIMQLVFTVDTETSEAQIIRKTGVTDVDLYPSGGGFTFIEVNERGNVLTTTVDIHGKTAHSRNTILDSELIPSQFYGTCNYEQ